MLVYDILSTRRATTLRETLPANFQFNNSVNRLELSLSGSLALNKAFPFGAQVYWGRVIEVTGEETCHLI